MIQKQAALAITDVVRFMLVGANAVQPFQEKGGQGKKVPVSKERLSSALGCVDQQDEQFVLVDEDSLTRIVALQADGFPTEGFAKHMGHRVTVRGIRIANGAHPLFKARTVETLSTTCATQQPQQGKP